MKSTSTLLFVLAVILLFLASCKDENTNKQIAKLQKQVEQLQLQDSFLNAKFENKINSLKTVKQINKVNNENVSSTKTIYNWVCHKCGLALRQATKPNDNYFGRGCHHYWVQM
ncbi:MAG: hypothetical protein HY840_10670 [Bacteroidetes bacterium]|nr:hypothetical protein [Bacteroidota bacterium]